jgi:hypothetical protein
MRKLNFALTPPLPPHAALSYKERAKEVSFYWRGAGGSFEGGIRWF